jgi:hypothetical protein
MQPLGGRKPAPNLQGVRLPFRLIPSDEQLRGSQPKRPLWASRITYPNIIY